MNLKLTSYILTGIGIVGIFLATPKVMSSIPFLSSISPKYILIPCVILTGIGIILLTSQGSSGKGKHVYSHKTKMGEEIPIFHGKEIVGYRINK